MLQHHNNDLTQARRYRQRYTYDPAGNILELAHRNLDGEAGHYTRSFTSESANNRLQSMRQNGLTYHYTYDPNGNMTREATNRRYHWNYADQLVRYSNQTDGSAPTVDACYLYGADGIRVKKVVLNGGGLLKTTTYIGEVFEYCTRGEQAYNLIHLMDGEQRIALLRVGAPFSGDESQNPALQYILGDHLGNSSMTTNGFGTLVHREEFTPYGETSFGGYGEKRYRFTGKERDEESGLSYHRARYYAGWLGKWVSADPLFFKDMKGAKTKFKQNENKINLEFIEYGKNIYFMKLVGLYDYCRNNPVGFDDKNGEDEKKQQDRWIWPDNEEFKPEFNVETPLLDRAVFYKSIKNDKGEEIGRCEVLYVTADASVQDGVSLALGVLRTESSADGLRAGVEFLTAEAMLSRKGVKAQVTLVESKVGGTVVKDVPIPKLGNADVNASFVLGASAGFEFSQERVRLKGAYVVGVDVSLEFGSRPLMDGVRRAISDSVPTMLDHVTTSIAKDQSDIIHRAWQNGTTSR
jgi:RHS repeat-associated protein